MPYIITRANKNNKVGKMGKVAKWERSQNQSCSNYRSRW